MNYYGNFGPAGIPRPGVDKIADFFKKVIALPEIQKKMEMFCVTPAYLGPEEWDKFLRGDYLKMAELAKRANIRVK